MSEVVERDAGPVMWVEPFAAMFWRVRVQSYLLLVALVAVGAMGYCLYALGMRAAAHVYEVHPDGRASYIGDREANLAPRPGEAAFVAKEFIERMYGWNSSTVHQDLATAVGMCSGAMATQLRKELADATFVDAVRRRQIRSEVFFGKVDVLEHSRSHSKVRLSGEVQVFPLTQYEGAPIERKRFANVVVLAAVPRDPARRLNGLEVVRLVKEDPGIAAQGAGE